MTASQELRFSPEERVFAIQATPTIANAAARIYGPYQIFTHDTATIGAESIAYPDGYTAYNPLPLIFVGTRDPTLPLSVAVQGSWDLVNWDNVGAVAAYAAGPTYHTTCRPCFAPFWRVSITNTGAVPGVFFVNIIAYNIGALGIPITGANL